MKIGTPKVKLKKREIISVHLPQGYKQKLQKLAFDEDRSLSSLVKRQIDKMLEEKSNTKRK